MGCLAEGCATWFAEIRTAIHSALIPAGRYRSHRWLIRLLLARCRGAFQHQVDQRTGHNRAVGAQVGQALDVLGLRDAESLERVDLLLAADRHLAHVLGGGALAGQVVAFYLPELASDLCLLERFRSAVGIDPPPLDAPIRSARPRWGSGTG